MHTKPDGKPEADKANKESLTIGRGAAKFFYYGLALDSISNSVRRAKTNFKKSGTSIIALTGSIFKKRKYEPANSKDEIESTFVASAHNIVASIFFTLIFLSISVFKSQELYATVLNFLVAITFFVMTICYTVVYLKSKEMLSEISKNEFKPTSRDN